MDGGQFCALALGGKCGNWEDIYEWEIDFPDDKPKPPFVEPKEPSVITAHYDLSTLLPSTKQRISSIKLLNFIKNKAKFVMLSITG